MRLPKRVFNSPLIRYANFEDGSFINLIRLSKPYANGNSYAVYGNTKGAINYNGLLKNYDKALQRFNIVVSEADLESSLVFSGVTGNAEKVYS